MIRNFKRTATIIGVVAATSASLVACGNSAEDAPAGGKDSTAAETKTEAKSASGAELTGTTGQLVAEGATSQQNAMDYFASRYAEEVPGANLAYNPTGSGAGVKNFIGNQAAFAGSDSALKDEEIQPAADRCGGNEAWHLPMVVGPVAVAYNLDGVDKLNLTVDNIVNIFNGTITKWNDPAIAESNPGATLPDENISVIYRSDESGTSDNFQKFLAAASDGKWEGSGKAFPQAVGAGANGSTGVAEQVKSTPGAITYVEAGFAEKKANIDFGAGAVELNEETVGKALDTMEFKTEGHNMVVDSKKLFATKDADAYPLILTTYEIVCSAGYDEKTRDMVKDFLNVALDSQDEELSAEGFIPVSGAHAERLRAAVNAIS
ncbi:phosphate ABC transporter substrate-binding protein PstS [Corynebacterium liangguodongii]|uniref:Phosphate-binding protein n=1 Tax=Corynebacterium liangguodongii TaxID=2079535 RepID=A0A2S0WFQ4_9CORY|nr:phosphate ABC transporter substrate-binding protein PstS [Corynebacterium liangguodongii]AWB84608.1 phosphate ABC transporter substrate-binding protein PstS [Corynebacterium liangguodongii]PWB99616.1 phosphate ABC transporter substrate-binding protein PstS [Corynebacterium liangguodongii]